MNFIKRSLERLELFLASLGLFCCIGLTFCQVLNRYWLHYEIMWIPDMALYIFIFSIYIAIAYGSAIRTHIAVDIFPNWLCGSDEARRAWFNLVKSFVTMVMIASMGGSVVRIVKRAWKYPEFATLVRWFNMSWMIYAMAAMFVLAFLHYGWHAAGSAHILRKLAWEKEQQKGGKSHV